MATPWPYDPKIGDEICRLLVEGKRGGPMSLSAICRKKGMPSITTVFRWLRDDSTFSTNYVRAREEQAHANADQIQDISDTEKDLDRAKVRIDARKWYAGRMAPKSYGDKVDHQHAVQGAIQINVTKDDLETL